MLLSPYRPVAVDLYCAAGGVSAGLHRAGFAVVGVDLAPQPHYPLEFVQDDALAFLARLCENAGRLPDGRRVRVVTASPPCFLNSTLAARLPDGHGHLDLIPETRQALQQLGLPYVIENVPGAELHDPVLYCGSMFELGARCRDGVARQLRRHRLFESSAPLTPPGPCRHVGEAIGCHGGGPSRRERTNRTGTGSTYTYQGLMSERREAMGIGWMNRDELNLAIPPTYAEHIGHQLLAHLARRRHPVVTT